MRCDARRHSHEAVHEGVFDTRLGFAQRPSSCRCPACGIAVLWRRVHEARVRSVGVAVVVVRGAGCRPPSEPTPELGRPGGPAAGFGEEAARMVCADGRRLATPRVRRRRRGIATAPGGVASRDRVPGGGVARLSRSRTADRARRGRDGNFNLPRSEDARVVTPDVERGLVEMGVGREAGVELVGLVGGTIDVAVRFLEMGS